MAYYAIAIGREQKITQDYYECKRLTSGFSGAKFKRTETYEEAEYYINKIVSEYEGKSLIDFEEIQRLKPSFINANQVPRGRNESEFITLSISSHITETYEITKNIFEQESKITKEVVEMIAVVSTNNEEIDLNLNDLNELDTFNSFNRNYYFKYTEELNPLSNENEILLNFTSLVIDQLSSIGINHIHLVNESTYLSNLMMNNIFRDKYVGGMEIAFEQSIKDLYNSMMKLTWLFISQYGGGIKPVELTRDILQTGGHN